MLAKQPRKFIWQNLKPFKNLIIIQVVVSTWWAIDLSLRPYLLKLMIDQIGIITSSEVVATLGPLAGMYLSLSLLIVIAFRILDYSWLRLNPPLKRQLGQVLMHEMMQHSQSLFNNHFAGNLANKIKDVMSYVPDLVRLTTNHFYAHFASLAIAFFFLWNVHIKFALTLAIWVLVFIIGSFLLSRRGKQLSDAAAEVRSTFVGTVVDILSNMVSVRLFSATEVESQLLRRSLDQYVIADQKRDWYFLWLFTFQGLSFVVYQCFCLLWLISGFQASSLSAGDFVMILTINIAIISNLWSISEDIARCAEYLGCINQGLSIALSAKEIVDQPGAKALQVSQGDIKFDKVLFHYKGTEPLFKDLSVQIHAGQKVGLVGYSGGGKSTFVNLILRLYEATGGQILIDGQDISVVTQTSLHQAIAMIPQDPSLFHRTLLENIRYSKQQATDNEVIKAAKQAHAHDFISYLPEEYNSLVGERGVKLSGGQRQRIAIARAFLKNAPILILDEATSQLDSLTESDIQESFLNLMAGKTTIVIAHRLSTLLHMDRILVFNKGQIVEDGPHEELLKRQGLYKTLWDTQVGGFILDKEV